ncbi:MAG: translin family protein [Candidatus Hydrothermarchaeota archaeon]|nr:translin family protein [Candidatus Hydrothermarchaeota archaeon]
MNLNGIINEIKKELDGKDKRREEVFASAREIRRISTKAMREIHKENYEEARVLIQNSKAMVSKLSSEDPAFSFLQEALQEYSEAVLTYAFLKKEKIPTPLELDIPSEAYVLGLADSIGELRRYILDVIRKDDFKEVEYFIDLMDEIFHEIMAFDYPSAIIPIRRKQDIARILLEKTRGEVTLALKQTKLEKKLEGAKLGKME